jgi:formylglycine-generating enzyme required for sulfatase activity
LKDYAWFYSNSEGTTHPVAQKTPNAFGLYDMYGNVRQWVQDKYKIDITEHTNQSPSEDGGFYRVVRGGSWRCDAQHARSAERNYLGPRSVYDDLGVRFVREIKSDP